MKNVFFLLFASAMFSFAGCKGGGTSEKEDSSDVENTMTEGSNAAYDSTNMPADTSHAMGDTSKTM